MEGDWSVCNKLQFKDLQKTPNGNFYIGFWNGEEVTGWGLWIHISSNLLYQGFLVKEKPEGVGRFIKLDINMYEGECKEGRYHGNGFFTDYSSEY